MLPKTIRGPQTIATPQSAGLMSAADKQKLNTIIDDTADSTSTTSTWSAAKVAQELAAAVPTSISDLTDDSDFLTNTEFEALIGANSGLATLDSSGKVPSSQLPSYVDDVLEYSDSTNFPATGESSKIYVDTTSNKTYRWGGSEYVEISESLALGETESTAYRGDRGKVAYDHATAKGSAYTSGLYKITTNAEGHVTAAETVTKADITGLGIPAQDTTYQSLAAAENGTDVSLVSTGEKYVWNSKASGDHTHLYAGSSSAGGAATNVNVTATAHPSSGSKNYYFFSGEGTATGSKSTLLFTDFFLYRATESQYLNLSANGITGGITFRTKGATNNGYGDLVSAACSAHRIWTLPDTTGTIALTSSDITGTAAKATADADGNTISSTYLKLSGGTVTGATTIKNILTLYRESSTTDNAPAGILFSVKDTTTGSSYAESSYIYAYQDHGSTSTGLNMVICPGGNLFIGSGEGPASLYPTYKASTAENLFITADGTVYMYANAQTIANRIGFAVSTAGAIVPQKAEAANNNVQNIGASNNKWANVYATTFNGALSGNATTATSLASSGTSAQFYRGDQTWTNILLGPLKIGASDVKADSGYATDNIGMNNYIAFYGVNGDAPGSYTHTFIGERIYGSKTTANEQSELLLFHGNDVVGTSGPDRIRAFAGAFRVDTFTSATSGAWPAVGESGNAIQALNIDGTNGIVLGNTTARSNGVNQTTIHGHVVINGSYNTNNSYSEGLRINKSSDNWAIVQLGGAAGSTTGTAEGQYLFGVNGDGYGFWSHNGSNSATARIQGHKNNGWSIRPRLYVNTDCGTDYNLSINGSTNSTTYTVDDKIRLEYNSTDQSLDFVFI